MTASQNRVSAPSQLTAYSLLGIPRVNAGDCLRSAIEVGLQETNLSLENGDAVCVTSKLLSRAESRFVDLSTVSASTQAMELASQVAKDPRLVELVLRESDHVSRAQRDVLIVRHRLGFVCANAGIDASNAQPSHAQQGSGPWVLLLPEDPDGSARRLREELHEAYGVRVGVIVTDSHGRAFRLGTVGVAIGCAGLPALVDRRGDPDLDGRLLEHTDTALADQIAGLADLMAGQGDEGRPVTLIRGARLPEGDTPACTLYRSPKQDLFA